MLKQFVELIITVYDKIEMIFLPPDLAAKLLLDQYFQTGFIINN